jgi:alcohol dehydrogenase
VDAVADDVRGVTPGDRVAGLIRFGAYATDVNVDARYLRPIRDGWSLAEAAASPVQGLTAWYGLVRLGAVERDDVVLVQSAAGGVGLNALAILSTLGARVVAVVGSDAKRQWLVEHRGLPEDAVIVRERRTFAAQLDRALASIAASGFDVVFDAVAGAFFQPAFERLREEGRMVVYGAADFMPAGSRPNYLRLGPRYLLRPRVDPMSLISANRSVMGFNLIWLWDHVEQLMPAWTQLDAVVTSPPLVGRSFPFAGAPAAMRHLQSGSSIGKVVLEL